jgi:hypothetical protein
MVSICLSELVAVDITVSGSKRVQRSELRTKTSKGDLG